MIKEQLKEELVTAFYEYDKEFQFTDGKENFLHIKSSKFMKDTHLIVIGFTNHYYNELITLEADMFSDDELLQEVCNFLVTRNVNNLDEFEFNDVL